MKLLEYGQICKKPKQGSSTLSGLTNRLYVSKALNQLKLKGHHIDNHIVTLAFSNC